MVLQTMHLHRNEEAARILQQQLTGVAVETSRFHSFAPACFFYNGAMFADDDLGDVSPCFHELKRQARGRGELLRVD